MSVLAQANVPVIGRAAARRGLVIVAILTLAFAGLTYHAWQLQVVRGPQFRSQAARQHESVVRQSATRGAILDADGKPLAITADGESIFVTPSKVVDVSGTAETLARLLGRDVRELEDILASPKQFAWLARFAEGEQIAAIRAANLPGVQVRREPRRWYPASTSIGTVIGFAGIDGEGIDGLELSLNDYLQGQDASIEALRDARGKTMLANGTSGAVAGSTVRLSIDRTIQDIADAALREALVTHKARSGSVVVLNVKTGRVLAMATGPNYDSNKPGNVAETEARNRAITDAFEMGSVMKLFTIATALDTGTTTPDEPFNVHGGKWKVGRSRVTDTHEDHILTTAQIIKRSSNVGTVQIAARLGGLRLYEGLKRFGFGEATGIELPGERGGALRHGKSWRDIELATISFGYGLTVTPLQLAAAVAAIGNDGIYQAPRLIADITDAYGRSIYQPETSPRRVVTSETAAAMREMMRSVFEGGELPGTAAKSAVPGFVCGGKTGTARKLDPSTKSYVKKYYASFAGLAPIDAPTLAIVVLIDEPTGTSYSGGGVAAPVFARVASESLRYLGVPGGVEPVKPVKATGALATAVAASALSATSIPTSTSASIATAAAEREGSPADGIEGALLFREELGDVPDFTGLSMAKALALASARGVEVVVHGSGRAVSQATIWQDGKLVVELRFAEGEGARRP